MITLAQAFRLCSIEKDEAVYLRHAREKTVGYGLIHTTSMQRKFVTSLI